MWSIKPNPNVRSLDRVTVTVLTVITLSSKSFTLWMYSYKGTINTRWEEPLAQRHASVQRLSGLATDAIHGRFFHRPR